MSKHRVKKKDVLLIFVLQEMKNSNVFDKNCTQENVKCHIQYEKGNIIFRLYLKAFLEEVIVMHTQKMRAKYMKEDV